MTATNPTRRRRIRRPRGHVAICGCDDCMQFRRLSLARAALDVLNGVQPGQEADQDVVWAKVIWEVYGRQLELFESQA